MPPPLLQLASSVYPQSDSPPALFTWETARALGGVVLSLTPETAPREEWNNLRVLTAAAGERAPAALRRALDAVQPGVVLVQDLGALDPSLLFILRERGLPYAVFLHDFTPLCPTHRLWHRRQELCSGPGRTGFKCAWCVSGARQAVELPLRALLYRHRPRDWRTALVRADALIAPSRFARDYWVEQGAPPERIAVIAPCLTACGGGPPQPPRGLLYAGGPDLAPGSGLLAAALDLVPAPVQLEVVGAFDASAQDRFRAGLAPRHACVFHAPCPPAALARLLAAAGAAVEPTRWQQPFSPLIAAAQAAGVPVAATATAGNAEQIIHGVNGFLADADDPQALAEAITEALNSTPGASWDHARVAAQAAAAARQNQAALEKLLQLLATGATDPDPALVLEHGAWLERHSAAPPAAAAQLAAALREPEAADPVFAARALATSRQWLLSLNRALAFFRAAGCSRIAFSDPNAMDDLQSVTAALTAWGLGPVPLDQLPDGLWLPETATAPALRLLRARFPQAHAVVSGGGPNLQTTLL
jgi:glycosyltransferase involved in cell wall biosynthesis